MLESTKLILYGIAGRRSLYILWLIIGSRFRKSIHASLLTMSFCAGVVVSVAFQQVDGSPDAETGTEGDDEGLENADSRVEKFHICVAGIIGC